MNQEDIKRLAERLTADEPPPREIPSSEECRNRKRVVIPPTNEEETREETVDGVLVGSERLMLVRRWEKRLGVGEESPGEFLLLPYSAGQLVEISRGLFRLTSVDAVRKIKNGRWRQSEDRDGGLL